MTKMINTCDKIWKVSIYPMDFSHTLHIHSLNSLWFMSLYIHTKVNSFIGIAWSIKRSFPITIWIISSLFLTHYLLHFFSCWPVNNYAPPLNLDLLTNYLTSNKSFGPSSPRASSLKISVHRLLSKVSNTFIYVLINLNSYWLVPS